MDVSNLSYLRVLMDVASDSYLPKGAPMNDLSLPKAVSQAALSAQTPNPGHQARLRSRNGAVIPQVSHQATCRAI